MSNSPPDFSNCDIVQAETDKVEALEIYIDQILKAIGHPEAFVTDRTIIGDFLESESEVYFKRADPESEWKEVKVPIEELTEVKRKNQDLILQLIEILQVPISRNDLIIDVAKRIKDKK